MTRTRRQLAALAKGVLGMHIGVRLGARFSKTDIGRLEVVLNILRKRFIANITLGLDGLEPLGFDVLSKWLAEGYIDQSISSGHDSLIVNDLLDAAIRSRAESLVFVDAVDLLQSPARSLKFLVERQGAQGGAILDVKSGFLQVSQKELLRIRRRRLCRSWREALQHVYGECTATDIRQASSVADGGDAGVCLAPRHLFVTRAGIERLGGEARYKELPLRLGGAPPSKFERAIVLTLNNSPATNDESFSPSWREIVAIQPTATEGESVVFDIWPAPFGFTANDSESDFGCINVPR